MNFLMNRLNKFFYPADGSDTGVKDDIQADMDLLEDFDEADTSDDKAKDNELDDDTDKDDEDDDSSDEDKDEDKKGADKNDADADADEEKDEDKEDEKDKEDKDEEGKDKEKPIEAKDLTARNLREHDPKIFKVFPDLKDTIYQNREYNKLFGSVEEAQEAREKAETFDQLAETTLQGDPTDLLAALEKTGKGKTLEFIGNVFDYLRKESTESYYKATDPVIAFALKGAEKQAAKTGDKNLALAVKYISQFVFGEKDIPSFEGARRKETDPDRIEWENQKKKDAQTKYEEQEHSIHEYTERKLSEVIKDGLDPQNVYNEFVRDALVDKIIGRIGESLSADRAFQGQMRALWKRAVNENFSPESKKRIASTFLNKARRVMPAIRSKIRGEAAPDRDNKDKGNKDKKDIPSSGGGRHVKGTLDPKKVDWRKSDDELLAE